MNNRRKYCRRADEHWFVKHWRPAMAWSYFATCIFDFLVAPIFLGLYAAYTKTPIVMWEPITLKGGGLYHISMGAIIGITAYGRTQEKLNSPVLVTPDEVENDPADKNPANNQDVTDPEK